MHVGTILLLQRFVRLEMEVGVVVSRHESRLWRLIVHLKGSPSICRPLAKPLLRLVLFVERVSHQARKFILRRQLDELRRGD